MTRRMDFSEFAAAFSGFVWGTPLIVLLFGTHLYLTFRTGFIQRYMPRAIRISMNRKSEGEGEISQFGALMTALAATIGAGNIIGVGGAVAAGGPGAVFWMWLTGVFGIATKYSEAILAVKYRVRMPDGSHAGGPMYALELGLGQKWLGIVFAVFTCIAAFGIGNMFQANAVVDLLREHVKPESDVVLRWVAGGVMAAITGAVILGGVRSIAKVCGFLVPIMAAGYVLGCVLILIKNAALLPQAFTDIWEGAFSGQAAVGGFLGATIKQAVQAGVARGLFSNESGLGSAPIVAAAAQTRNPVRQALVSSSATFWDTVVVCLITGLVLVSSGHWKEGLAKGALTNAAFADLHTVGPHFPALWPDDVCLFLHPGLELLRGKGGGIPGRPARGEAVPHAVGGDGAGGRGAARAGGDGLLRRGQRPDGGAEPDLPHPAEPGDQGGDAPAPA